MVVFLFLVLLAFFKTPVLSAQSGPYVKVNSGGQTLWLELSDEEPINPCSGSGWTMYGDDTDFNAYVNWYQIVSTPIYFGEIIIGYDLDTVQVESGNAFTPTEDGSYYAHGFKFNIFTTKTVFIDFVNDPPSINGGTSGTRTYCHGDPVSFSVSASGEDKSYIWQKSTDGGAHWSSISGETSSTLSFTANSSQNGYMYRCRV